MVQFYPKAVSKSYWKRMDVESKDVPRGMPNLWRACSFSPTGQRPDDRARYRGRGPLSLQSSIPTFSSSSRRRQREALAFPDLYSSGRTREHARHLKKRWPVQSRSFQAWCLWP